MRIPIPLAARCSTWIEIPTVISPSSQYGCSARKQAVSISRIISGVEYTGGNSAWCAESVCFNSTVSDASPCVPMGMARGIRCVERGRAPSPPDTGWRRDKRRLYGNLRCRAFHPPCLDAVQHGPQSFGRSLGGSQRFFGSLRIGLDPLLQLFAPHLRVVHVSGGVQRKIAASLLIGAIEFTQAAIFFLRQARHLRFVGIESRQRLVRSALAGDALEPGDELANLPSRPPFRNPASGHAFQKIEPQFGVRTVARFFGRRGRKPGSEKSS